MKKINIFKKKTLKVAGIIILGLFILLFLSDPTFLRFATLGMADVYDFKYLPVNKLKKCESNFSFERAYLNKNFDAFSYNGKAVNNFEEFLEQNKTTAFIIVRNDSILYENYFKGHNRDSVCKVFSITKNVLSTLIGIAIDQGYIKSIHNPIINYIPELKNKGLDEITLYHCLNGTAGIKYNGSYFPWSDEAKMYYRPNIRKLLQNIKLENKPGTVFHTENYSSQLLGWVLEKATGTSVSFYLQMNLWQPLGMSNGKFVIDSEKNKFEKAESGLVIRPIDLVKFGRLWLNEGDWNGKQIVPEDWIISSTHLENGNKLGLLWKSENKTEFYKNMWWGFTTDNKTTKYSANGHFGQRLVIVPDKHMIVLRFGAASGNVKWGSFISQVIEFVD